MIRTRKLVNNFLIALIITIVGFLIFGRITAFRILSLSFSTFYVISLKYFELSKSVKILLVIPVVLIFVVLRYYLGDRFLSYITYMILISFAKVYQE